MKKVSVIIGARNEWPQICFTIMSVICDLETFLSPKEFEVIVCDNGSDDNVQQPNIKGTSDFLRFRGMFHNRILKIMFDPVMGNVSTRNKGVLQADGEYIFFVDAHVSVQYGTFKKCVETLEANEGAIVHTAVDWLGAYPPESGYGYSIKCGEKIWGVWNRLKVADTAFAVPATGHCFLGVERETFLKYNGYNPYFRCYGGGEIYLDLKWWMLGLPVLSEPNGRVYHLSAGRGYNYHNDDLMHNMMLCAYVLGGEAWAERTFITYLNKPGVRREKVKELYRQALQEGESDYKWIKENAKMDLDAIVTNPPWDLWNMEKHGKKQSYITIFEEWLKDLKDPEAIELYKNSKLQQDLSEKIKLRWPHLIYKGRSPAN